jgi:hypothetical protein
MSLRDIAACVLAGFSIALFIFAMPLLGVIVLVLAAILAKE